MMPIINACHFALCSSSLCVIEFHWYAVLKQHELRHIIKKILKDLMIWFYCFWEINISAFLPIPSLWFGVWYINLELVRKKINAKPEVKLVTWAAWACCADWIGFWMSCIVNVKKVIGWYLYIQHQRINCLFAIIWQRQLFRRCEVVGFRAPSRTVVLIGWTRTQKYKGFKYFFSCGFELKSECEREMIISR